MKTTLSLITSLLLIITGIVPGNAFAYYSDVPSQYADAVSYLEEEGMVSGYPDGSFRPGNSVNRVEFLKLSLRATFTDWDIRSCPPYDTYDFTDTSRENWYAPYLCMAVRHGIVSGYPDGSFRPAQTITLAEAAKILATLDYDYVDGVRTARDPLPFEAGDEWYGPAVRYLASRGALPRSISSVHAPLTRGQVAEIIYRLHSNRTDLASSTYEDLIEGRSGNSSSSRWRRNDERPAGFTPLYLNTDIAILLPAGWVGVMIKKENSHIFRIDTDTVVEARCPIRSIGHDLVNTEVERRIDTVGEYRYDYTFTVGTPKSIAGNARAAVISIKRYGGTRDEDAAATCELWGPVNGAVPLDVWEAIWDWADVPSTMGIE
ncbi:MAG: S-layer homology domain-containing protein [Candidatus Peribacteraceae bacterium]|jgi:hypothetical protein